VRVRGAAIAGGRRMISHGKTAILATLWTLVSVSLAQAQKPQPSSHFSWPRFGAGLFTSVAAHELAHVVSAIALGGSPSLRLDSHRPVIESGLDGAAHPARAFTFSAAGMAAQLAASEVILDWPHDGSRAGSFERGFLAGGIATVAFYVTVGRNAKVGDMAQMERFSGLSPWTLTAIFGSVALSDAIRIVVKPRYGSLFLLPLPDRRLAVGVAAP
jgi:hypothetical protein